MKFMLLSNEGKSIVINLERVESFEPVSDDDRPGTYVKLATGRSFIAMECFNDICAEIRI